MPAPRHRAHDFEITGEIASGVFPKASDDAPRDLEALYDELAARCRTSDEDDLLVDLVADRAPGHLGRVSHLRREQASLLRSVERLLRTQDLGLWELNVELQILLDALLEADRAEADLLQDAWLTDLGDGD